MHPGANYLRNLKWHRNILFGQVVLEILIKTMFCTFLSITQEPHDNLLKFECHVCVSQFAPMQMHLYLFQISVDYFETARKI